MRKLYWRPHRMSRVELALVALLALGMISAVESFPSVQKQPYFREKMQAARLAKTAMEAIKEERVRLRIPIAADVDPQQSGMIGDLLSPVVSNRGHLPSKQLSINPNFAALLVHYLKRVEAEEGALVAVGLSGSFPAINVAVYAALETLKLRPVIISSASASQFGATDPRLTWLDMERILADRRLISFRSVAASRGGIEDRALGMSADGKKLLDMAIERNGVRQLRPATYEESVELRMSTYLEHAGDASFAAYVNVGGGAASVGTHVGKRMFRAGLNRRPPHEAHPIDSVMLRLARDGVPVIHLTRFADMAARYGFPIAPTAMPSIGEGKIFVTVQVNRWLAGSALLLLIAWLTARVRFSIGMRFLAPSADLRRR